MRALVAWADDGSNNLGARALAQGSTALLKRVWPDIQIETQNFGRGVAPTPVGRFRGRMLARWTQHKASTVTRLAHVLDSPLTGNDVPAIHDITREHPQFELVIPADLQEVRDIVAPDAVVVGSRVDVGRRAQVALARAESALLAALS